MGAGLKALRRGLAVIAVVVLSGAMLVGQAFAGHGGTCNRTRLRPGQRITVRGSGMPAGAQARLLFDTVVIGGSHADGAGFYRVSGPIPSGATPDEYDIHVRRGATLDNPLICRITVTRR